MHLVLLGALVAGVLGGELLVRLNHYGSFSVNSKMVVWAQKCGKYFIREPKAVKEIVIIKTIIPLISTSLDTDKANAPSGSIQY
jgi:hypothetical protein